MRERIRPGAGASKRREELKKAGWKHVGEGGKDFCPKCKLARKPVVSKRLVMRDWVECSITLRRGLTGAKPEKVCHWAFEMLGARPDDELADLFPGTGAVTRAWETWRGLFVLPAATPRVAAATNGVAHEQNQEVAP